MGMTIAEKILARASGQAQVAPGDIVDARVDTIMVIDPNFAAHAWREPIKILDPERVIVAFYLRAPAATIESAAMHQAGRAFAKKFGIRRVHDLGPDQGIGHVITAENAYALPGTVYVCSDSHSCSSGVFNCAARGVGVPDIIYALTKGTAWFKIGETVRYNLVGRLPAAASAKDIFLHMAGKYGDHVGANVEYGGPGLASLSMDARRTLATMSNELSAEFAIFEPDSVMLDFIRARTDAPFEPQYPDADAVYADVRTIDLSEITPRVALPGGMIGNSYGVDHAAGTRIDQAFIGSCANGNLDDLAAAARVLTGHKVAPHVRLIITPGSQAIYLEAVKRGIAATLMEAGAVVTNATCGACSGGSMGLLGDGETCITASTRNFKGRMGHVNAKIFMASPATVAASAIAGVVADPTPYFEA